MAVNRFRADAIAREKILRLIGPGGTAPAEATVTIGDRSLVFSEWNASTIAAEITAAALPELADATLEADGDDIVITGPEDDDFEVGLSYKPTVTIDTTYGVSPQNQLTRINFNGARAGTYTVTLNGETTAAVTYGDEAGLITAINALTSFSSGDVVVTVAGEDSLVLEFKATYAAIPVVVSVNPAGLANGRTMFQSITSRYTPGPHDVWALAMTPSTTCALTIDGSSATIRSDMSLDEVLSALQSLSAKEIAVYGGATGYSDAEGIRSTHHILDFKGWDATTRPAVSVVASDGAAEVVEITDPTTGIRYDDSGVQTLGLVSHYIADYTDGGITIEYDGIEVELGIPSYSSMSADADIIQAQIRDVSEYDEAITGQGPEIGGAGFTAAVTTGWINGKILHIFNANGSIRQTGGTGQLVKLNAAGSVAAGAVHTLATPSPTTGGTFKLELPEGITADLSGTITAGALQTALAAIVTGTTVTGNGVASDPWVITYTSGAGSRELETPVDVALIGHGTGSVSLDRSSRAAKTQQTKIAISTNATGGSFLLSYNGEGPVEITLGDSAATVEAALATLPSIASIANIATVYDATGESYEITFDGSLVSQRLPPFVLVSNDLDILTAAATSVDQLPTGPRNFADPVNWTLNRLPQTADTVVFDADVDGVLYGLRQFVEVTADAATDVLTAATGHDFRENQTIRFTTTGTLPAGLSTGTDYFVLNPDGQYGTFRVSATSGGSPVNITDAGTGTHSGGIVVTGMRTAGTFRGQIGREQRTANDVSEYLTRYLMVGLGGGVADIGAGDGQASGLVRLDFGRSSGTVKVYKSASSVERDRPAVDILANSTGLDIDVRGGVVGVAGFDGDSATVGDILTSGGALYCGTVAAQSLARYAGTVTSQALTVAGSILMS